jgi:hypothetical protein
MTFRMDFISAACDTSNSVAISSDLIIFYGLIEIESSALGLQFSHEIWCSIFDFVFKI